jgi:hypothetical protein
VELRGGWRTVQVHGQTPGEAHKDLHITSEEFHEVGAKIAARLSLQGTDREKQEVLTAIVARKDEVISPDAWLIADRS